MDGEQVGDRAERRLTQSLPALKPRLRLERRGDEAALAHARLADDDHGRRLRGAESRALGAPAVEALRQRDAAEQIVFVVRIPGDHAPGGPVARLTPPAQPPIETLESRNLESRRQRTPDCSVHADLHRRRPSQPSAVGLDRHIDPEVLQEGPRLVQVDPQVELRPLGIRFGPEHRHQGRPRHPLSAPCENEEQRDRKRDGQRPKVAVRARPAQCSIQVQGHLVDHLRVWQWTQFPSDRHGC